MEIMFNNQFKMGQQHKTVDQTELHPTGIE